METRTERLLRCDIWCIICCFFLLSLGLSTTVFGQVNKAATENGADEPSKPKASFRVSVDEVRIDAVVLDHKGRQETNLTADDFEIYQDNKKQDIISCIYINASQGSTSGKGIAPYESGPPGSVPMLKRDEVRRTIVFLVDDFSMTFQEFHFTRMGLKNFVENQMQPGDFVTIFLTSSDLGAIQIAGTDKLKLLHIIENLRWGVVGCGIGGCGRGHFGIKNTDYINEDMDLTRPEREILYKGTSQIYNAQIASIRYSIRALRDMPGRKYLMLISSYINFGISNFWNSEFDNLQDQYAPLFNKLADLALRANIVIHTLDIKGLQTGMDASRNDSIGLTGINTSDHYTTDYPLSSKTGGMTVKNTNFFLSGIGPVNETIKGYYLLTYLPPAGTFEPGRRNKYYRIKVKVKGYKFGREILTRDGFYGGTAFSQTDPGAQIVTVKDAIRSPFLYNDLKVRLASGYAGEPDGNYFLRSWMHLDGKDLTFKDEQDGRHSVALDAAAVTTDMDGIVRDSRGGSYDFFIRNEDLPAVIKRGIDFDLYLPVQNSGSYYIRSAVKDRASEKIGTSYQFIEVPDLKKKRLSLSSIFIINSEHPKDINKYSNTGNSDDENIQILDGRSRINPAVRRYNRGEDFSFVAIAYNAKSLKGKPPQLESQYLLFKEGEPYLEGKILPVFVDKVDDFKNIPITGKIHFKQAMEEGQYVLQLRVTDKQAKKKRNLAVQSIDFEILDDASENDNRISALR